jgi:hypothetical protein
MPLFNTPALWGVALYKTSSLLSFNKENENKVKISLDKVMLTGFPYYLALNYNRAFRGMNWTHFGKRESRGETWQKSPVPTPC